MEEWRKCRCRGEDESDRYRMYGKEVVDGYRM